MNQIKPENLPSIAFEQLKDLPNISCIYFALSAENEVLYVGCAVDLHERWLNHHRKNQLSELNCARLSWLAVQNTKLLGQLEKECIREFLPRLNYTALPNNQSNIRTKLAEALSRLVEEKNQPIAQTARELGYTRQRLHQLKSADRSAAPEAIEEAINKLGYVISEVKLERK